MFSLLVVFIFYLLFYFILSERYIVAMHPGKI
jgi:hypothetical protein